MAEKIVLAELEIDMKALVSDTSETIKLIAQLKEQQKQLQKETNNLTNATDEQAQAFIDNAAQIKILTQNYNENLKTIAENKKAIADQEIITQLLTATLNTEVTSINEAREQNALLTKVRNELNVTTAEGQIQLALLNNKINENNDFVKENADAMLQQKMNIGNYSEGIKSALAQINPFNGGLTGFIERSKEAGGVGNLVKGSLSGIANGFMGATKATLAFIATPIGALLAILVGAFALVKNAMNRSEDATNKITKIFTIFSGITNKLLKFLEPLGKFLIDGIVKGFELAGKAAEVALDIISGGLELLGFDGAAKNVKAFKNEMAGAVKDAAALADAEARLAEEQRKAQRIQLEYQKKAEKLRQIRDDESKSIAERIQANNELGIVLKQQLKEELRIAQTALDVANLRIKAEGKTKENLDAQAEALTTIADIQERITGQESEQLQNLNSLRKEAADKEKERIDQMIQKRKEAQDKHIEQMNEELALYIAKNQTENKSVEESLRFEQEVSKKRLAILKQEFDYGKISKQKYEEQKLLIEFESAKKQAQIGIDNLGQELKLWELQNKSKIESNKWLTDELVADEITRQQKIYTDSKAILQEQFDKKLISEQQFNIQKLQLVDEFEAQKKSIEDTYTAQKKAEQDERIALEYEDKLMRLELDSASEYELKLAQEQFQYENDLAILNQRRADGKISEENYQKALNNINAKYAKAKADIGLQAENIKLQGMVQVAQGISQIVGQETAVGKAAAIAGATIDTYRAANLAIATLPPPYGGIQAGISIATGLANVAKIVGVKGADGAIQGLGSISAGVGNIKDGQLPKAEQGGLFEIGGKRHSQGGTKFIGEDGTAFEAEQGELIGVMNRNASRLFMDFNNQYKNGGLVQRNVFATGGIVERQIASSLNADINYDLLAEKIASANSKLPAPVVYTAVTDINTEQANYAKIVNLSNH